MLVSHLVSRSFVSGKDQDIQWVQGNQQSYQLRPHTWTVWSHKIFASTVAVCHDEGKVVKLGNIDVISEITPPTFRIPSAHQLKNPQGFDWFQGLIWGTSWNRHQEHSTFTWSCDPTSQPKPMLQACKVSAKVSAFNSNIWNFQVLDLEVFLPSKDSTWQVICPLRVGYHSSWERNLSNPSARET